MEDEGLPVPVPIGGVCVEETTEVDDSDITVGNTEDGITVLEPVVEACTDVVALLLGATVLAEPSLKQEQALETLFSSALHPDTALPPSVTISAPLRNLLQNSFPTTGFLSKLRRQLSLLHLWRLIGAMVVVGVGTTARRAMVGRGPTPA